MRPTQPFMTLKIIGTLQQDVRVLLPADAQVEEHVHEGISFIVHLQPLTEGKLWVATEKSTGISFTAGYQTLTKDRAIQRFIDAVDALDIDRIHDGLMLALLELEDTEIMTVAEFAEAEKNAGYLDVDDM